MTGAELEEWVCDRASAIVESGEDLLPVVWSLTPDGNPVGVFITSEQGFKLVDCLEPAALVARIYGSSVLLIASAGFVRRFDTPPEGDWVPSQDPGSVEAVVVYGTLGEACTVQTREVHRDDSGAVALGGWESFPLTEGFIHDTLRSHSTMDTSGKDPGKLAALAITACRSFGLVVQRLTPGGGQ